MYVLAAAFSLRIFLSFFGTLELDQNTFIAWSERIFEVGFRQFYATWSDYLPGYLYVLWVLRFIGGFVPLANEVLYKLPAIFADLATGYIIYKIVKKAKGEKWALLTTSLYVFNPAVLANSTLWGQVDSLTALFSLLAVYLIEKNIFLSSLSLAVGTVIKPSAIFVVPVIFLLLLKKRKYQLFFSYFLFFTIFFVASFLPFWTRGSLPDFILERVGVTLGQYPYTSVNAFNFWGIFGMWKRDNVGLLQQRFLGYLLTALLFLVALRIMGFVKKIVWGINRYLLTSLIFSITFLFLTRMHERHMLPVLSPLIISSSYYPFLLVPYFGFSLIYVLNLIYSFVWITKDFKSIFSDTFISFLGVLNTLFLVSVILGYKTKVGAIKVGKLLERKVLFEDWKISRKVSRLLILGIVAFALSTRILSLSRPESEYFDEVYHAFTARRMLHGDPKAWEWWNVSPEGFAYEWTHPPLAKEGMVLGMVIFGENSFGWRVPGAILGTVSIYLVYLIAKEMFRDDLVGVFAAGAFALDGLPLVMSRIGMNDAYFLFFMLTSFYLFLKGKDFGSALTLGLAASSKWTFIWFLPLLGVTFLIYRRKFKQSLLWFFVIPLLVYLATYIPMFLTGHGWEIFIGVQKQMWWYHTQLKATHPYTSPWWSWPFLLRPIWLYTASTGDKLITNIYAMGNPSVFWVGTIAVGYVLYLTLKTYGRRLGLTTFSYFIFFVPWAISPRIMFLYHYLPSIPFMAIAIGILLRKNRILVLPFFAISLILFVYFYPHWTGIQIPTSLDKSYYWFSNWR